jgi:hypothetical protein
MFPALLGAAENPALCPHSYPFHLMARSPLRLARRNSQSRLRILLCITLRNSSAPHRYLRWAGFRIRTKKISVRKSSRGHNRNSA